MHRLLWIALIMAVMHAVPDAASQTLPVELGRPSVLGDIESARFTGPGENLFQGYMRETAERQFAGANLTVLSNRFFGIERYQASSFDLAFEGAGAGATLGLFAGALANTAGVWDEDTSWYIAGAAAALGAFLGYSSADDSKKRTRYRWSIDASSQSQDR